MKILLIIISTLAFTVVNSDDYDASWSDNMHSDCKHQDLMKKLEKDPRKCALSANGTDLVQWEECKKKLKKKLISLCPYNKLRRVR